jgi:hypothetical protein
VSAPLILCRRTDPKYYVDSTIFLGDDDPSDYETDVDYNSQRAESAESDGALCSSPETTFDSRTSVSLGPEITRRINAEDLSMDHARL